MATRPDAATEAPDKQLLLVVGPGRSGTSVFTGTLQQLGFRVPQPEVTADATNPRGFGEPAWVVDFHNRLLFKHRVHVSDSRPDAWFQTGKSALDDEVRAELRAWLQVQFVTGDHVVIKDPRLGWFLSLWRQCAQELGIRVSTVTILREPAEVLHSLGKAYGDWQGDASRAGSWINMMLYTERATRDTSRSFVRYTDMLQDWPREVARVGEELDLVPIRTANTVQMRKVYDFIDPSLRRSVVTWDDLDVPQALVDLVERVWELLLPLTDPKRDTEELRTELDTVRATYLAFHQEAEKIAQSSVLAERPRKLAAPTLPGAAPESEPAAPKKASPPAAPKTAAGSVKRIYERIPTRYRRKLPHGLRRRLIRTASSVGGPPA
jgi:hypothetical protein